MKIRMLLLLSVCAGVAGAGDLFFAGDSTLHPRRHQKTANQVFGSWGDEVEDYLRPGVKIVNCAESGASTLSFINSGRWGKLVARLQPGDWVVIEFGHNDQKIGKKGYYTAADGAFRDNLRRFAKEVRAKGAEPLFASPIVRRVLGGDGHLVDGAPKGGFHLNDYGAASRAVAEEVKAPFVDMNRLTHDAVESAGPEKSLLWYRAGVDRKSNDFSHPVVAGARLYAKLFVDDVKSRGLKIAELLK